MKAVEDRLENVEDSFFDSIINESEYRRAKDRYQNQSHELSLKKSRLSNGQIITSRFVAGTFKSIFR